MKVSSIFLFVFSFAVSCSQNVFALATDEHEASTQKEIKKLLDTETIKSPYYTKILYRSQKEEAQKNNQNKDEIIKVLQQTIDYTPEEIKSLTENFETNPPINYNASQVTAEKIKNNPVDAFYQLSVGKDFNPDFFKTQKKQEMNYDKPKNESISKKEQENENKGISSSIIPLQLGKAEKPRLGKKSFKINPDQFY